MSILRQLRNLSRQRVRFVQSSSVVFRAVVSPSASGDPNTVVEEEVLLDAGTRIFAVKRTSHILRSLFVLKLCSYDIVARESMVVCTSAYNLHLLLSRNYVQLSR